MRQLKQQYPGENKNTGGLVISLRDELSGKSRLMLWALLGASGCVFADRLRESGESPVDA